MTQQPSDSDRYFSYTNHLGQFAHMASSSEQAPAMYNNNPSPSNNSSSSGNQQQPQQMQPHQQQQQSQQQYASQQQQQQRYQQPPHNFLHQAPQQQQQLPSPHHHVQQQQQSHQAPPQQQQQLMHQPQPSAYAAHGAWMTQQQQQAPPLISPAHSASGDSEVSSASHKQQQQQQSMPPFAYPPHMMMPPHATSAAGAAAGAAGFAAMPFPPHAMAQYMSMMSMHGAQQSALLAAAAGADGKPRLGRPPKDGALDGAPPKRSQYRGVSWDKSMGAWRCKVNSVHVGYFDIEDEAARAYDEAALALRGQGKTVKLNFAEQDYTNKPGFLHYHSKHDGRKRGTSSYRGVLWDKGSKAWRAKIKHQSKTRYLGLFQDERLAAEAYDRAALQLRGGTAQLNFPLPEAQRRALPCTAQALSERLKSVERDRETHALAAAAAAARAADMAEEEAASGAASAASSPSERASGSGSAAGFGGGGSAVAAAAPSAQAATLQAPQAQTAYSQAAALSQAAGAPSQPAFSQATAPSQADESITSDLVQKYNRTQRASDTLRKRLRMEALKKNAPLTASAADAMAMLSQQRRVERSDSLGSNGSDGSGPSGGSSPGEPADGTKASAVRSALDTGAVLALAKEVLRERRQQQLAQQEQEREQQEEPLSASSDAAPSSNKRKLDVDALAPQHAQVLAAASEPLAAVQSPLKRSRPDAKQSPAMAAAAAVLGRKVAATGAGGDGTELIKNTIREELGKLLSDPDFLKQIKAAVV